MAGSNIADIASDPEKGILKVTCYHYLFFGAFTFSNFLNFGFCREHHCFIFP